MVERRGQSFAGRARAVGACSSMKSGERGGMTKAAHSTGREMIMMIKMMMAEATGGRGRTEIISRREKWYSGRVVVAISGDSCGLGTWASKKVQRAEG